MYISKPANMEKQKPGTTNNIDMYNNNNNNDTYLLRQIL